MTLHQGLPTADAASTALPDDEMVTRLVSMVREASGDALTAREQAGLYRLEHAVLRNDATPRTNFRLGWLLLPAALGAAAGAYALRERAITFQVVSGKVGDGGYIAAAAADASVHFSDHSDFGLEPGTRMRVSDLEVRGARVLLEGGTLHVRIHTQPRGKWTLDAGPYIVHVTGTEFDLAWRVDEQTLDLRLHRGSVTVEGPLVEAGVQVGAGQHLVANANAGTLQLMDELNASSSLDEIPPASLPPSAVPPTWAPTASSRASAPPSSHRVATPASGRTDEPSWGARVAHGDFDAVIEDAERRGIDRSLAEASVVDLAALADAARYARRQDVARRALVAERTRYPGSVQARDAAFFLGGLAEAQKSDAAALDWYDVYLRESTSGAYASQALGRKMMLVQRLRGTDGARPIGTEYLARFPDGPYAPSARKLLQAQ
jgi:FecR-like protein